MSKTPAEIATEARKSYETSYEQRGHYDANWRAKCDAYVANAIIDECAKIADLYAEKAWSASDIAADIRALKSAGKEDGNG